MPAVTGYLRMGLPASRALVARFGHVDAFGFALKRADITVLDVDTPDERVLADALTRHGRTPIMVRTQSGNWQAWYRNGGEGRSVRPFPNLPIDVLGKGYVFAPPPMAPRGPMALSRGRLMTSSTCRSCAVLLAMRTGLVAPQVTSSNRGSGMTCCLSTACGKRTAATAVNCWPKR